MFCFVPCTQPFTNWQYGLYHYMWYMRQDQWPPMKLCKCGKHMCVYCSTGWLYPSIHSLILRMDLFVSLFLWVQNHTLFAITWIAWTYFPFMTVPILLLPYMKSWGGNEYIDVKVITGFVVLLFAITLTRWFTSFFLHGFNYIVSKLSSRYCIENTCHQTTDG